MGGGWRYPTPQRPAPTAQHRRAEPTIRAAIDATVDLLDELPEHQVTFEAVRARSGVSKGSLTHHFGSRSGLIATAHVQRYVRTCELDDAFLGRFVGSLTDATTFSRTMIGMIDDMLTEERRSVRWQRMSAIAAALHDPELERTLSDTYTRLTDRLTTIVAVAHEHGILAADADARTAALLISMHAQGLVLDDIVGAEVSTAAWNHLQVRFVMSFLTPDAVRTIEAEEHARYGDLWRAEVFGPPGRVPAETRERLDGLRALLDDPPPGGDAGAHSTDVERVRALLEVAERGSPHRTRRTAPALAEARTKVLDDALRLLRTHGAAGVDVDVLRDAAGLSPQAFHRLFGGRDLLVRMTRIHLEIARAAHGVSRFARFVESAGDAAAFRVHLEHDAAMWMAEEPQRQAMRQRIETLDATRTDSELRGALARIQRTARDLLIEEVCRAQARGLIDPELPARGVARFLDGSPFWHIFHGLDDRRPDRDTWLGMLRRITAMLSPDGPPEPATPR